MAIADDVIEQIEHIDIDDEKGEHYVIIQLGANWIHCLNPANNPMAQLAQELNYSLQVTSSDDEPGDDVLLYRMNKATRRSSHTIDTGGFAIDIDTDACDCDRDNTAQSLKVSKEVYRKALARYEWMKNYLDAYCERHYHHSDDNDGVDGGRASMDSAPPLYEFLESARLASERVTNQQSFEDVMFDDHDIGNKINNCNEDDDDDGNNHDVDPVDERVVIIQGSPLFGHCSSTELSVIHWLYDRIAIDLGTSLRDASMHTYMEGQSLENSDVAYRVLLLLYRMDQMTDLIDDAMVDLIDDAMNGRTIIMTIIWDVTYDVAFREKRRVGRRGFGHEWRYHEI